MTNQVWALVGTFATSLIPGLELRAGIPTGVALGLPTAAAVVVAVIGNVLQIQLAILVMSGAQRHAGRFPGLQRRLQRIAEQAVRHQRLIQRYGWLGLTAFVLLPLPGTGVWGGVILARLFQVPLRGLWFGVSLGIALSGIVVGLATHGTVSLYRVIN